MEDIALVISDVCFHQLHLLMQLEDVFLLKLFKSPIEHLQMIGED